MPIEPERSQPVDNPASAANKESSPADGSSRETPRRATRKAQSPPRAQKSRRAMAPSIDGASSTSSSAVLNGGRDVELLLGDASANARAMIETTNAIIRANTIDDLVRASLDAIRKAFGWAYASYWSIDTAENALVFRLDSGRVDDEFQRLTRTARFREGEGLNGRAWRQRDLFYVEDLAQLRDCCRAPLAARAGIHSGIALPLLRDGQVIGT